MVLETYEHYSVAWAMNGVDTTTEKSPVTLLTDISDLQRGLDLEPPPPTTDKIDKDLDELDGLDPGGALGEGEKRELKQLEKWKEDKIKGEGELDLPKPPGTGGEEPPPEAAPPGEAPLELDAPPAPNAGEAQPGEPSVVQPESPAEGGVIPQGESGTPTAPVEGKTPAEPAPRSQPPAEGPTGLPEEPPPAPEISE